MRFFKLLQYMILALLVFSLSQTLACKKTQAAKVETKKSKLLHKMIPGARFDKRGLDLRKTRKVGFPSRFKGIKKGKIVIEKRDGLNTKPQTKAQDVQKADTQAATKTTPVNKP